MLISLLAALALGGTPVVLPNSGAEVVFDDDASGVVASGIADMRAGKLAEAAALFETLADAGGGADMRYLEALARYEAGDVRRAERAAVSGIEQDSSHAPLLALRGLVLRDLGRGSDALPILDQALARARSTGDGETEARALLHQGLVQMDRGDAGAKGLLEGALGKAEAQGLADVASAARANLALMAARTGATAAPPDALGQVVSALRSGDRAAARAALPPTAGVSRREAVLAWRARAALARAEGDVDGAATALAEALTLARGGGLVLDTASALGELAVVYQLIGRWSVASQQLDEAIGLLAGTHFKVEEVAWRVEAGRVALRLGDREAARTHLDRARSAVKGADFPGAERIDELSADLLAVSGDLPGAEAAWGRAATVYEQRGWWADAARVSTAAVRSLPAGKSADLWRARAESAFARSKDPLGVAHVEMARGLSFADARDLEAALASFAAAKKAAEGVDSKQAKRVAAIADENAAQALVALGHGAEAVERGLDDAVARHAKFAKAEESYRQGLTAYDAQDYTTSRSAFDSAFLGFRSLKEEGYATAARRGRAWSAWNHAVAKQASVGLPFYGEIQQEAVMVGDVELETRASVAHALAMSELNAGDPLPSLRRAADLAEQNGLPALAASAWAELAEREKDLVERARAARRALQLSADGGGAYAMYSVAVDAMNGDQPELAVSLAREVLPQAGDLTEAVQEVLDAATP